MSEYTKRITVKLRHYKKMKGCETCGYNESGVALDFAHIDPTQKSKHMCIWYNKKQAGSGMIRLVERVTVYGSKTNRERWRELKEEIRKCRVLCKNCHYVETYNNNEANGRTKLTTIRRDLGARSVVPATRSQGY